MLYTPAPLLPPWTAIVGFVLGAITGSFLNMLIWRLPRGKSLVDPAHSICPRCDHRLTALDLMPILSWLRTRGKCRHCAAPIASRYLWVEVLVGSLFTIIWVQTMCVGLDPRVASFAAYAAAAAILVAIVFIDGELYIIPDELNAALLFVGIAYGVYQGRLHEAVFGAFLGWALLWGFVFLGRVAFGKDAMGDGDIKMMRGVGALLGPTLLLANVGLGVVLGLVGGIAGLAIEGRRENERGKVNGVDGAPPPTPSSSPFERREQAEIGSTPSPTVPLSARGEDVSTIGNAGPRLQGEPSSEPQPEATPIPLVLLGGVLYLTCLDVVALFLPPLRRWIAGQYPPELVDEEQDWEPAATAIPFGPYLAAGALICMLAGTPIQAGMKAYWDHATGATQADKVRP